MQTRILFLIAFLAMAAMAVADKTIFCYYESWAKDRHGEGKYPITSIPANLCTHVLYSFVGITKDGNIRVDDDRRDLHEFTRFVKKHAGVKAILSIGGWSEGSKKFSKVANDKGTRDHFVRNVVEFLEKYGFDGLDVDWEYPAQRGGQKSDKDAFTILLKHLRGAFAHKGFILSAAVAADADSTSTSYDIPAISEHLDYINIMTYDFNGNSHTSMNAPLYPSSKDDSYDRQENVNFALKYWLKQGAPPGKINLGVPFYGRSFTLKNPSNHGIHAPATGGGKRGPYTDEEGLLGYNEICTNIQNDGWQVAYDEEQHVPYAYKGNQWVGYDNAKSITEKAQLVKSKRLAGVMIWSIDTDDFTGKCGKKNELLKTLNAVLRNCAAKQANKVRGADPVVSENRCKGQIDGLCVFERVTEDSKAPRG